MIEPGAEPAGAPPASPESSAADARRPRPMPLAAASLVLGILVCGIPMVLGGVSVWLAVTSGRRWESGDRAGAVRSARASRWWAVGALVATVLVAAAFLAGRQALGG